MKTQNVENYLNSFGKQVVNRAKGNLQKAKGGGSNLESSIKFKISKTASGYTIQFIMNNYGTFVDKGVSGTDEKRSFKDYNNKTVSSPYRFGTGSSKVGKAKGGMSGIMAKWVKKKGFQWKDKKTGRFMSHKSMGYLIAKSKYRDGIQGISFFQKPLGLGIKQFGSDILKAIKLDVEKELKNKK
jgi:hypothetical protein